ncbi:HAMP domain-containing sensor histidine kinase [Siminovitchia sp. FSL H7-0308]|uniref:sensor histidine kinase n=1 Tax=Siminovitchia sp. FSL H7-0308 TaxID=2921432 RepID=UPI0030EEDB2D
MGNMLRSFRTQMIIRLCMSMATAGGITYGLYKILQFYYQKEVKAEDPLAQVRLKIAEIGDINFFLIIFIPLAIVFFFFFTKSYSSYFKEISTGIHQLANGDFNTRVRIRTRDEFGDIAEDINKAGEKLKDSLERGDFAESSKDQLIVNLAHDLRTPLTSVLGYLDLVLRESDLTKDQIQHYLTIAHTKSVRLEKLIDELFEVSRLNYGMLKMKKEPLDLGELLMQLKEEFYPELEKNRLTARMDVAPDLQISADGEMLARVFENLLSNAVRYGADGKYIDIKAYVDEGDAVVEVVNYGNYIAPESLAHIFDVFFTGDKSRSVDQGSTGLGLFIAKNIVEQHDGAITAKSDPVQTIFAVRLPMKT